MCLIKLFVYCFIFYLLRGLQKEEIVLLTHGDSVDKVADGFKVVARSGNIVAGKTSKTSADFLFKSLSEKFINMFLYVILFLMFLSFFKDTVNVIRSIVNS